MNDYLETRQKERTMKQISCLLAALVLPGALLAEPVVLKSNFDSTAGPNHYEVNFPPELGGGTIFMPIVGGSFELETDAATGSARLLSWNQDISAIDIFGKSTGPITVTIQDPGSSVGTFDASQNQFAVTGSFLISFDDTELKDFGFFSPIALVGTETGNIYGSGSIGTVRMYLEGSGSVAGGSFTYTCRTSARFEYVLPPNLAQPGDCNHDQTIDISDPIAILGSLFQGSDIDCPNAAEVNSDAAVDISDAVFLISYLFQGGTAPSAEPVSCDVAE